MTDGYPSLYADPRRYDLVHGRYATGAGLDFYRRQIARYGEPVLELACGSGRLMIPLAAAGVQITGLDLSEAMLSLAVMRAAERGVDIPIVRGDMRSFQLGTAFQCILIAAQSLTHLQGREELEACFSCVRRHLADEGRVVIALFHPSVQRLARDANRRYGIGAYDDPQGGTGQVMVTEQITYDAATQLSHIRWSFHRAGEGKETVLAFAMRQFFAGDRGVTLG
jgi:cyclopropane fatty-acyl-phospholipid synthase-like methyltransferase